MRCAASGAICVIRATPGLLYWGKIGKLRLSRPLVPSLRFPLMRQGEAYGLFLLLEIAHLRCSAVLTASDKMRPESSLSTVKSRTSGSGRTYTGPHSLCVEYRRNTERRRLVSAAWRVETIEGASTRTREGPYHAHSRR